MSDFLESVQEGEKCVGKVVSPSASGRKSGREGEETQDMVCSQGYLIWRRNQRTQPLASSRAGHIHLKKRLAHLVVDVPLAVSAEEGHARAAVNHGIQGRGDFGFRGVAVGTAEHAEEHFLPVLPLDEAHVAVLLLREVEALPDLGGR